MQRNDQNRIARLEEVRRQASLNQEVMVIGPMSIQNHIVSIRDKIKEGKTVVVYVDGGLNWQKEIQSDFYISIGDGDSVAAENCSIDILFPQEKNESDLDLALKYISQWPARGIFAFGLLGGRRDHEWVVLGSFYRTFEFMGELKNIDLDNGAIKFLAPGTHFLSHVGLFSVCSFETSEISIEGLCKYNGQSILLKPFDSRGLSNEAQGDFKIYTSKRLVLFFNR